MQRVRPRKRFHELTVRRAALADGEAIVIRVRVAAWVGGAGQVSCPGIPVSCRLSFPATARSLCMNRTQVTGPDGFVSFTFNVPARLRSGTNKLWISLRTYADDNYDGGATSAAVP